MRYQSSFGTLGENVPVGAVFPPGDTVTVVVKDMDLGSTVTITSGATTEITINSTSSLYTWNTSQITSQPTTYKSYAVIFTNAAGSIQIQKIVKGGSLDSSSLAEYQGAVHIDTVNGSAGTAFPIGTARVPVSNYADALTIATALGFKSIKLRGSITLTTSHVGWSFESLTSALNDSVAINGQNINNSRFSNLSVSGACGGSLPKNITFDDCRATSVTAFDGVMADGGISSSIGGVATGSILLRGTKFLGIGGTINANGATTVFWSGAAGLVTVTNFTAGGGLFLMQADAVDLTFASSCTGGFYAIGGVGSLTNSGTIAELQNQLRSKEDDYENVIPAGVGFSAISDATVNVYLVVSGGSATVVRTNATQANNYWNDLVLAIKYASGEVVARNISSYSQTNGAFTVSTAFPTTPTTGDTAYVVARNAASTAPTADAVADAVWDELKAGHVGAGSFGLELGTNQAEHDTTQAAIAAIPSAPSASAVADAVWDEPLAGHLTAGSTGEALDNADATTSVDYDAIADAVWDELLSGHTTAGSAGKHLSSLAPDGLVGVITSADDVLTGAVTDADTVLTGAIEET